MTDKFILNESGVYAIEKNKKGDEYEIWLSSPIEVARLTRNKDGNGWGKVISFTDSDGNKRETAIPSSMFARDGAEIRERLLDMGVSISSDGRARGLFNDYLNSANPPERGLSVTQTGWHDNAFVLPDEVIGESEPIYFQTERPINVYSQKGTVDEWRDKIGKYCIGNNKLTFAVSLAFSAPLLHLLSIENGGFHMFGPSSCGKSTALRVAASVYGKDYITTWRATDNGLEGAASAHNDTLLIMDEMGQVSPYIVGEIVYMLANGEGKSRADRRGNARHTKRWRIAVLSSGEIDLDEHLMVAGRQAKAGQEVRLIGIPAIGCDSKYGVFENIHEFENGAEFSKYLCDAVDDAYGTPFKEFVANVIKNNDGISDKWKHFIDDKSWFIPQEADGQVRRAMWRFLLVAFAGELATEYDITGWSCGDATEAAKICFMEWIQQRGGIERREAKRVLEQAKQFVDENSINFIVDDNVPDGPRANVAGYKNTEKNELYVLPSIFSKKIINGIHRQTAIRTLIKAGWLLPAPGSNRNAQLKTILGKQKRVYVLSDKVWTDDVVD